MKKITLTTAAIIIATNLAFSQGAAINTNGAAADSSAMLDVSSTNKGVLISRLTTAQRNAISNPANSLLIYNTDLNCLQIYINSQWQNIFCDLGCTAAPPSPGSIIGNNSVCENAVSVPYYIAQVPGANSYSWSVPSGANIVSGQGSTGIIVNFGSNSGFVSVSASNNCGASNPSDLNVTVNTNLPASVSIAESEDTICSGTSVTFTATPVNGGASPVYQWKLNGSNVGTNNSTYIDSGLNDGDKITCVMTSNATCATGSPATSNTVSMTVYYLPGAPVANSATGTGNDHFTANWNSVTNALNYRLDVSTDIAFGTFVSGYQNLDVGIDTLYDVTGLSSGTTYYYRVKAENSCGAGTFSDTITVTTTNPTIIQFTTAGTTLWDVPAGVTSVEVLVVAGGGGGGWGPGGGGGAGGLRYYSSYPVTPGSGLTVTVGGGGNGALAWYVDPFGWYFSDPTKGGNSVFDTITSAGGGAGSKCDANGDGGSGGGGCNPRRTGISGQGNDGGNASCCVCSSAAGGGGGAGTAGQDPYFTGGNSYHGGNGGDGLQYSISGTPTYYAGGGGGGASYTLCGNGIGAGSGGLGGGGNGELGYNQTHDACGTGGNGASNTGGGGGGGGFVNMYCYGDGGNGGSGIVIIKY